jgi:hypothetical protein
VRHALLARLETAAAKTTLAALAQQVGDGTLTPNAAALIAVGTLTTS